MAPVAETKQDKRQEKKGESKKKLRLRIPRDSRFTQILLSKPGRIFLIACGCLFLVFAGLFTFYYIHFSRLIEQKLKEGPFVSTAQIFSSPQIVAVGDSGSPGELVARLSNAGYSERRDNAVGTYRVQPDAIEIFPGPRSLLAHDDAVIRFSGGKIARIVSLSDNTQRGEYQVEPQLITNLHDRNREKRRFVRYQDLPSVLIHAVLSAEDKRFFQHSGFDPVGILRALWVDVKQGRNEQGASTLTMQLAKGMWLSPERNWKRKASEMMITLQLEQRLSKEEILELYCNQIDLGNRGSFTVRGFGEAAQAYFGKDVRNLSPAEAATLAGMLRGASYYNPLRHPDRIRDRRNNVLALMRQNGYLTDREYALAVESPVTLASASNGDSSEAPYFVDLVSDELASRFQDQDFQSQSYRIYTTLDPDLQKAANDAVAFGMPLVDDQIKKQKRKNADGVSPQVAMIVLDPHTGEVKALVGGRNYGMSQLNRVLAHRQPGSIFKPFVYATAINTGLKGGDKVITAATTVVDEPTTFMYDGKPYEPGNFGQEFYGVVTLRRAIAKSMNVATIKVAEMAGYGAVVQLAHSAGINGDVHATPSMAIGSYDATPLEMAGAYTVFANGGVYVKPRFLTEVRAKSGAVMYESTPEKRAVLDPRVDYIVVDLLQEVMRSGTAAGVRARGFSVPAAGKTGTSRDGWFAGFTSQLLCIVWVGYDDNRELNLEGAHSALPIWTEFMKRALMYRPYRNVKPFTAPDGVVTLQIDSESGQPATPRCPTSIAENFLLGTEPVGSCRLHGGTAVNVSGWDISAVPSTDPSRVAASGGGRNPELAPGAPPGTPSASKPGDASQDSKDLADKDQANKEKEKKRGFFKRLFGIGK